MKKGLFDRRIPTVFALIVLAVIVGISTILVQSGVFYIGKAAPDTKPQNFMITNITDTSFTAYFSTNSQVEAVLSMSDAKIGKTLTLDDRDKKTGSSQKYYSHHITVFNLNPNSKYFFKLLVGGNEYQSSAYTAMTANAIAEPPPASNPIFGKILLPGGEIGTDTIVTARTDSSQLVSTITDQKGEFILPTNSLRISTLDRYEKLIPDTNIKISAFRNILTATATTNFKISQNLPPIILAQNYSFLKEVENEATKSPALNFTSPINQSNAVTITTPKQNESFIDRRPRFKGTAVPGSKVNITILGYSEQQVTTNPQGAWSFLPKSDIAQGDYKLTISTTSSSGQSITLTRSFTIFAQGSQVAQTATPSATPRVTPTPTTKPTPTPTLTPSPTPTVIPTGTTSPTPTLQTTLSPTTSPPASPTPTNIPSPTLTPSPTITPTAAIFNTPTSKPTLAPSGNTENTVALTGFSIVLIVVGLALLFAL